MKYLFLLALASIGTASAATCKGDCGAGCATLCDALDVCSSDSDCITNSCTNHQCDPIINGVVVLPQMLKVVGSGNATSSGNGSNGGSGGNDAQNLATTIAPAWVANIDNTSLVNWKWQKNYGIPKDLSVVNDPNGSQGKVMKVMYPAKSFHPQSDPVGGVGITAWPVNLSSAMSVTIEYQVWFPKQFNWVKGGKLPGLFGGHEACTGGNPAVDCFSTRFMWRTDGAAEVYLYVDQKVQTQQLCRAPYLVPNTVCNPDFGISVDRGGFSFSRGVWNTVRQVVTLNTFDSGHRPKQDGSIQVFYAGDQVFLLPNLILRKTSDIGFLGIDFETFFGGNDKSFATPTDQYTYFKDIKLWYQ